MDLNIIFFRSNILALVPSNVQSEGRTDGDANLHDQILWVLHQSGVQVWERKILIIKEKSKNRRKDLKKEGTKL